MPSSVQAAAPSTDTQAKVNHSLARGQVDAVEDDADEQQDHDDQRP